MNTWLPQLLQSSDSMFPTGAYAHSYGMEGAVQDGLIKDIADFRAFINDMVIPGLEKLELPTAAAAFKAAQDADLTRLCELDQRYGAMKPSRELREATARTGRQRLLLNLEIADEPFWRDIEQARSAKRLEAYEPIVLGTQGALGQMPLDDTLGLAFYHGLTPFVNAALKLVRTGQLACQKILSEALAQTAEVVDKAKQISTEEMGWLCPALDISSARHETAFSRLFIS
jgi:urease accessory protein